MATGYILWDRKAKCVVSSSGAPIVFRTRPSETGPDGRTIPGRDGLTIAAEHVASALDGHRGQGESGTYDVIAVNLD